MKNTLATIQAMVAQTFQSASREEHEAFFCRIVALSEAHELLTQQQWNKTQVGDLVNNALGPFNSGNGRIFASGPDVKVAPNKALVLTMLIHELATNAVKYGALSVQQGRVDLTWRTGEKHGRCYLRMCWTETGGPPVHVPKRTGFGTKMIERALSAEEGSAKLEYQESGLICRIEIAM